MVPFGYEQHPVDPDILLPIPFELEALQRGKELLKEYSLREVANWLTQKTGRYISHEGLKYRLEKEAKSRRDALNYRWFAKRYKEASAKAEKLEKKLGGIATFTDPRDPDIDWDEFIRSATEDTV